MPKRSERQQLPWRGVGDSFSAVLQGADKSLARQGRKQANVSVRRAWISFGALSCRGKKIFDDSSRLDVVEIARDLDLLPSFLPSWSG